LNIFGPSPKLLNYGLMDHAGMLLQSADQAL